MLRASCVSQSLSPGCLHSVSQASAGISVLPEGTRLGREREMIQHEGHNRGLCSFDDAGDGFGDCLVDASERDCQAPFLNTHLNA